SCGEQRARDHDALYLARPFVDRRGSSVASVALDRVVTHVAVAAEYLHSGVRGALCHLARVELGHRCLACEWTAAIAKPRRAEREEARRGEIALRLRDAEPESLEIRDRPAELPPLLRVSAGDLERAACDPDGLRRDADAPAIESGHRDREAFPHLAQHCVGADGGVLHDERARVRRAQAELLLRWSYGHSWSVQRQHERSDARARALRVELAGAREHDRERGVARVRDQLLSPLDAQSATAPASSRSVAPTNGLTLALS